jgi:hypothetical protein
MPGLYLYPDYILDKPNASAQDAAKRGLAMTPIELENIKTNARIAAIELLLAGVLTAATRSEPARQSLLEMLDQMPGTAENTRFPSLSPEFSDLISAELQQATETLVAFLKDHLQKH